MKANKIIVFLVIVAALGSGLYLFQRNKQEKALIAHNNLKFQQLTEAAEKNRHAGLLVMASAINKFHQIKGHYPDALSDLYPEFIPDKTFISKLNWKYYPENGSYLIKRSIKGQTIFVSMGPDLKLKTGRDDSTPHTESVASLGVPNSQQKTATTVALKSLKTEFDLNKNTKFNEMVKKASSPNIENALSALKIEDERNINAYKPSAKIVKKELNKDEQFLLSFDSGRLYIWKTKNGIIGFSNIQYPDEKQLTIYRDRTWIEYGTD